MEQLTALKASRVTATKSKHKTTHKQTCNNNIKFWVFAFVVATKSKHKTTPKQTCSVMHTAIKDSDSDSGPIDLNFKVNY
jgi:hypothetical protein